MEAISGNSTKPMILILADPLIGGTFLTWSLHYLAGHDEVYSVREQKWRPLVEDPVGDTNAHRFNPNQADRLEEIQHFLDNFAVVNPKGFHSLYFHNFTLDFRDQKEYFTSFHQATADAIAGIIDEFESVIVLTNTHPMYNIAYEERSLHSKFSDHSQMNSSGKEQRENFIDYFYTDSLEKWKSLNLNDVWDQREFLALNMRPLRSISIKENVDLRRTHYNLNSFDLYCTFPSTVTQLFEYLGIAIEQNRLAQWRTVYDKWRMIHQPRMIFSWYLPEIITYIINGFDMDLDRFNLDIMQEACIQHFLIYNHGLNLKTWQLEKFHNTRQLHNLLEPNSHFLTEY